MNKEYEEYWENTYECDCKGEVIITHQNKDDGYVDMGFFSNYTGCWKKSFLLRIKYAWQILTTGEPFTDLVCLHPETAKRLGEDLCNNYITYVTGIKQREIKNARNKILIFVNHPIEGQIESVNKLNFVFNGKNWIHIDEIITKEKK